jgi:hypothetical protein
MTFRVEIIPYGGERKFAGPFMLKSEAERLAQDEMDKIPDDCDNRPFISIHKRPCQGLPDDCCGECCDPTCNNCGERTDMLGANGFCDPCERDWRNGDQTAELL